MDLWDILSMQASAINSFLKSAVSLIPAVAGDDEGH